MSIKFLLFIGLGYLLYRLAKRGIQKKIARFIAPFAPPQNPPPAPPADKLVQCAACGVFVAEQKSVCKGGQHYCSVDCGNKA